MSELATVQLATEEQNLLRSQLCAKRGAFSFEEEPALASAVASLGLQREILTRSNELAPYIFDAELNTPVLWKDMRSELVEFRGETGTRIWAEGSDEIEVRLKGLNLFLHPSLSYDEKGRLSQLVFFPSSISQILKLEGAEVVIVPEWGLNTIFGGFRSDTHYYQTNLWELDNNDTLRFARLLAKKQIPFLGSHDITAHMSGVRKPEIEKLSKLGQEVADTLDGYFAQLEGSQKTRASLVIPYLIGVFLDDLAQPVNYGSKRHEFMISELMAALRANAINPRERRRFFRFPETFGSLIEFTRFSSESQVAESASNQVKQLVKDIYGGSLKVS